jgi:hypothetical protein
MQISMQKNWKEKEYLEDIGADGNTMLKRILKT